MEHKMVQLTGRVLKAPELEYGNKQMVRPQKGQWDMGRGGYRFKVSNLLINCCQNIVPE